jgi:hypothetical protein
MIIKNGEALEISRIEDTASCIPAVSEEILDNFKKFAANLKKIAPKAEDFLYFSAVMMHAAEASAIHEDGTLKLTASGEPIKVGWDKSGDTWRWQTNDPSIKPYKNSNGDIFPEEELVKAYKKWIGKPLCIDHKSSSVDHVRGFIVDTYYDRNLKRVIALCALDKHNYPDLARKVATGYSSSVSMGTAVGRAICSDCGRVARTESDFCEHMKRKSCYGEINVDLNPIELSIVVNGADPKAHIKHIIAAANTLNSYVETKEKEINKIANNFSASFHVSTKDGETSSIDVQSTNLEDLKKDVDNAMKQLGEITESLKISEKDTNDSAFNQSSGTVAMDETTEPNITGLATPAKYASTNVEADLVSELRVVTASIESKLIQMKQSLDKLATTSTKTQEENMSGSNINKKGYFQSNEEDEPTPGQPKYEKDPMNEKLRTDGDKHMDVDNMGTPEQLYPGDLERKKMLARAEAEERAMRRTAIVSAAKKALETKKEAYFQGGGGVNEPTPGKVKYPIDKLNEDLREDSDKHMVGQKPFPGVGPVDGMHPSPASADVNDEKKRKELIQRASLRARFVKASNDDGSQNLGKSGWEVFLGDKLLLTASVDELSGNRSAALYDNIANKQFGAKLLEKVKTFGAEKVRSLVKSAQPAPAPAPAPAPEAPPAEGAPEDLPEDTGGSGDPKEGALELAEKVRDLSSDLVEAVRALTGEQAEMGGAEGVPEAGSPEEKVTAASESRTLNTLRKELNGALITAMKEAVAELNDHHQELTMIAGMYDKGAVTASNKEFVGSIIEDALTEAKTAVADGFKLMTAFVKYARGTQAIVKRAEIEAELESLAQAEGLNNAMSNEADQQTADDLAALINETDDDLAAVSDMIDSTPASDSTGTLEELIGEINPEPEETEETEETEEADDNAVVTAPTPAAAAEVASKLPADADVVVAASFDSTEGRAALRAKLASDALKTSPHLHEAHPKGNATTKLDVKPTGDLGVVENLEEQHDAMMDLANAPPKVRKEAEAIHQLVVSGKLDPSDLDALIAEGLDKDAVAYYRKYFGQVDGGSEFASELVKEHVKAQMEEELNKYRVKLARAYELAYDMVDRGLCHNDRVAVSSQVDEIMKFNDDSFDSLKRVVAKHAPTLRKEAGHMPQVGMIGSGEFAPANNSEENLVAQLSAALSKTPKGSF